MAPRGLRGMQLNQARPLLLLAVATAISLTAPASASSSSRRAMLQTRSMLPPCVWDTEPSFDAPAPGSCKPNQDLAIRTDNLTGFSMLERSILTGYEMSRICLAAVSRRSCRALEKQGCIWGEVPRGKGECRYDSSYVKRAYACPDSPGWVLENCNVKRTSKECGKDSRCVWKGAFYRAILERDGFASNRDLCFHSAAANRTFGEYRDRWVVGTGIFIVNTTAASTGNGDCEVSIDQVKAFAYRDKCRRFRFQGRPDCGNNCRAAEEKFKETCLAAGCYWNAAHVPIWNISFATPCEINEGRYYELSFGPRAGGIVRNQHVLCYSRTATASESACKNTKL